MGTRKSEKHQLLTRTCTNQTTSWLVHNLNIFGARKNHEQTWTHKTHHNTDLGEATTFPLIIYSMAGHGTNIQMAFGPGIPTSQSWDSRDFRGP
jgi:hypothetical protein